MISLGVAVLVALALVTAWCLFLFSVLAYFASFILAQHARHGRLVGAWQCACFISTIWRWMLFAAGGGLIALCLYWADVFDSQIAEALITTFVAGPFVTIALDRAQRVRAAHRRQMARTLDRAIPKRSTTVRDQQQREVFNLERTALEGGSSEASRNAVRKIINVAV